jgi:2-polyprenyl-3-methyl-5-hydroxy-6-metoxy-1,4-benzoquinol methylase
MRDKVVHDFDEALKGLLRDYPWQKAAALYSYHRFRRTVAFLEQHTRHSARVLDVGAWPGVLSTCFRRLGWEVTAIDKDSERSSRWSLGDLVNPMWKSSNMADNSLSFAAICEREGIDHYCLDVECERLPFADESFDAVILAEVIEHLYQDPLAVLSEINRVLKNQSGILILSTPNLVSFRNRVNFLAGHIERVLESPFVAFLKKQRLGHLGHVRLYSPVELRTMLHLLGFESQFLFDRILYDDIPEIAEWKRSDTALRERNAFDGPGKPSLAVAQLSRLVRKFWRGPEEYIQVICASTIQVIEKIVPELRPQIFVIARKVKTADFDENYHQEVARLLEENQ